jgi:Flp pilus assembly pilin Flp
MKNYLKKFYTEERGSIIEYIIVLAVIAGIIIAVFPGLRSSVMGWFKGLIGNIDGGQNKAGKCPDGNESYYNSNAANTAGTPTWVKMTWDATLGQYSAVPAGAAQATVICHIPQPGATPAFP